MAKEEIMAKQKQVAILGLGVFGSTLAETLSDYGVEVLAIDNNEQCVDRIKDNVTRAAIADVTDKDQMLELGVNEFDTVVVSISKHFEESVLATMILKEFGVPNIIVKARTKRKKVILEKVGADVVVNVEKDMANKVAKTLLRRSIVDIVELDEEYSIVEIHTPNSWIGKDLKTLNVRQEYGMNIVGVRCDADEKMNMDFTADYIVKPSDHFLVVAKTEEVEQWADRKSVV